MNSLNNSLFEDWIVLNREQTTVKAHWHVLTRYLISHVTKKSVYRVNTMYLNVSIRNSELHWSHVTHITWYHQPHVWQHGYYFWKFIHFQLAWSHESIIYIKLYKLIKFFLLKKLESVKFYIIPSYRITGTKKFAKQSGKKLEKNFSLARIAKAPKADTISNSSSHSDELVEMAISIFKQTTNN